jgi:cyclohexanone monooxygenase
VSAPQYDVVVVGAGFAGLYALKKLRDLGFRVLVLEAGGGVGGTWYFNRYPGARCDVDSVQYSYSFSPELERNWTWRERYASQPEILSYIQHVAARFDLMRDIRLNTRVDAARYDDAANVWQVAAGGEAFTARYFVLAVGCLSSANIPDIPGRDDFKGRILHTGQWPHEPVSFAGRRVAVVGTGSSGIQAIPEIAKEAAHLTVFQRTPNYSIPARNRPLTPDDSAATKAAYPALRAAAKQRPFAITFGDPPADRAALSTSEAERQADFDMRWRRGGLGFLGGFTDIIVDPRANAFAADYVRAKIRDMVHDPVVAERLSPKHYIGAKRICVDTDYYATFNRSNVTLHDLRDDPICAITPVGVRTDAGEAAFDDIVFATGFDAMTGAFDKIVIQGRGGTLKDAWAEGPITYLGLGVAGFPNMFVLQGPGSPSVLTNMIVSAEFHVDWLAACLSFVRAHNFTSIEARAAAQEAWTRHVGEAAAATLYPQGNSWYLGANVPGKPRVFMPYLGFPAYVERATAAAARGYEGFAVT